MPEYFTLPELAERWKISIATVRRKVDSGELRPVYIGRVLRIEASEVDRIEAVWREKLDASRQAWNEKMAERKGEMS